ncbi:hypothetical protein QAD02_007962 [Eretmocerus hayati]|uniref:Uncharacterized protein n=1 Tax=Eretmocerus hayati TaxID=131215 RepID=A0ACC2N9G6_9HYME|nr:hypothetical protein QAD02_007962 [Eretmocerus hayati]
MWTRVPGPPRHRNADVNKEGWPCHRETGMRKPLECGSHWNAEAIGMRMRVPGPPRHRNADVNKEEWPCHRETGMRKPLECGSYWNADKTHGAAQSFDVGMRMQLYRVAWPLEIGRRMQLYRVAQPPEIGIRMELYGVARLLEIGIRMQLYGRLIHLTLESGSSCRRPPSFWNADETHGAAQPFDVQIAAVECRTRKMCRRPGMRSFSGSGVGSIGSPATRSYIRRATEWLSLTCVSEFLLASLCIELLLTYAWFNLHTGLPRYGCSTGRSGTNSYQTDSWRSPIWNEVIEQTTL